MSTLSKPTIKAHIDRISKGRVTKSLVSIIKKLKSKDFQLIFSEFSKQESIYGFGDLQVKRIIAEIENNKMAI